MQAPNLFASLAPSPVPAQGQGAGLGVAGAAGGLFGTTEGQGEATGDPLAFAEALMAAMVAVAPQIQQQPQAPVEGQTETAAVVEGAARPAAATVFAPTLLAQTPAIAGEVLADGVVAVTDEAAAPLDGEAPVVNADADLGKAIETANLAAAPQAPAAKGKDAAATPATPAAPQTLANAPAAPQAPAAAVQISAPVEAAIVAAAALPTDAAPAADAATAPAPPPVAAQQAVASAQAAQVAPPRNGQDQAKTAPKAKAEAVAATTAVAAAPAEELAAQPATPLAGAAEDNSVDAAAVAPDGDDAPEAADATQTLFNAAPAHAADDGAALADAPKVTSHTIAQLSAQITKSLEGGRSTRFDMQLEPYGLGKVDVRVEINKAGEIVADLHFENPVSAAELRSRSGELTVALQDAGFDPNKTQLSFSSGGQNQGGGQFGQNLWSQQQDQGRQAFTGRAFIDLADTPENTAAYSAQTARSGGVDVRI